MSARLIDKCGGCGGGRLDMVLPLGASPPTCNMLHAGPLGYAETHYPLELMQCRDCTLIQLSCIVDPTEVFPPDYPYSSGNSPALHANFESLATEAAAWLKEGDLVVDIGANDGTLLSKFGDNVQTFGVEPTGQAEKIAGNYAQGFFSERMAAQIVELVGQAKVVTACNVLAHVDRLDDVLRGIRRLLTDDGVLIAENHDVTTIVGSPWSSSIGGQWDTIYHEHLRYFSPLSFANTLAQQDMGVLAWRHIATHGGSFRMVASKAGTRLAPPKVNYDFGAVRRHVANARAGIRRATAAGGLWGIGATARATTIINVCGLDYRDIECVCEVPGSDKIGRFIPGTRIPVVDERELFDKRPHRAMLFSWYMADAIVPKLRAGGYNGEILVPLPTVRRVVEEAAA